MKISVNTEKLKAIVEKKHSEDLNRKAEEIIKREKAEREERCQLYEHGQSELKRIIALIPSALEEAAKDGCEERSGWRIEARIFIAEAPYDQLYPNRFNRHLSKKDGAAVEAIERSIHSLNQKNSQAGIQLSVKVSSRLKTCQDKHQNLLAYHDHFHQFFLVVTVIIPKA